MDRVRLAVLFAGSLVLLLAFAGCGTSSSSGGSSTQDFFDVTQDGVNTYYTEDGTWVILPLSNVSGLTSVLYNSTTIPSPYKISLLTPASPVVGTFPVNTTTTLVLIQEGSTPIWGSATGSITITSAELPWGPVVGSFSVGLTDWGTGTSNLSGTFRVSSF